MKLIIFEGCDRTGKDTLISKVSSNIPNLIKRHWVSPKGNTDKEKIEYQKTSFNKEFQLYQDLNILLPESTMIWNRAHIGELVYGKLYRNYDPTEWIKELEIKYNFDKNPEIYLIYLYADPEFLVQNDDGQSFSSDLNSKQKELDLFFIGYYQSLIKNKLKIKVNKKDQYTDLQESLKRINSFLYEAN